MITSNEATYRTQRTARIIPRISPAHWGQLYEFVFLLYRLSDPGKNTNALDDNFVGALGG